MYFIPSTRTITWANKCGLDPEGGIPTYPIDITVNITTPSDPYYCDPTGVTDCTAKLQAALNACIVDNAVYMPAGTYRVNGDLSIPTRKVLRGNLAASYPWLPAINTLMTQINLYSATIRFDGGTKATNWSPGAGLGTNITAGYSKDSTSITLSDATGYSINDYISIFENDDGIIVDALGDDWLGEDNSGGQCHCKQQYSKITNKVGNILTIDPAIYYVTPTSSDPEVRKQTFNVIKSGIENIRFNSDGVNQYLIFMRFVRHCWLKGVETYNADNNSSASPHVWCQFSYGCEFRDGFHHKGMSHNSGRNYGIEFYHWNSGHKIENNIVRDTRHAIIFEGGGSGCAVLYNYSLDNYEGEDQTYLSEDLVTSHGAHPHMNLWEGNVCCKLSGDYVQGTSSHNTLLRNKSIGYRITPVPTWNLTGIEIGPHCRYYNLVGNVSGRSAWTTGTVVDDNGPTDEPIAFRFGRDDGGGAYLDSGSYSTIVMQGNYDYITDGVARWDDADHDLPISLYYSSKPSWFGGVAWPAIGPDVSGQAVQLPAEYRYLNQALPPAGENFVYSTIGKVNLKGTSVKTFTRVFLKTASGKVYLVGTLGAVKIGTITVVWGDPGYPYGGWDKWKRFDGLPAVYDTNFGKIKVRSGDVFYSDVVDMVFSSVEKVAVDLTTVIGSGIIEWRGKTTAFNWDDELPAWETYTGVALKDWRFIQIRVRV